MAFIIVFVRLVVELLKVESSIGTDRVHKNGINEIVVDCMNNVD